MNRRLALAIALAASLGSPRLARADAGADAKARYDAAVKAFEERRFSDAAAAFEDAYRIKPAYQVLFNLGNVYAALGRPVESVAALERYLAEGGAAIDAQRRADVDAEIDRQRAKIGTVVVTVAPADAELRVDGALRPGAGATRELRLAEGRHAIAIARDGHRPETRDLDVAGRARVEVAVTLAAIDAGAPVVAPPPAAPAPVVAPPPTRDAPATTGSGRAAAGWVLGGVGLVGAGVGIGLVAASLGSGQQANDAYVIARRAGDVPASEAARADHDAAVGLNTAGWVVAGVGGAALLTGVVLLATSPSKASGATAVAPWIGPGGGGAVVGRRF